MNSFVVAGLAGAAVLAAGALVAQQRPQQPQRQQPRLGPEIAEEIAVERDVEYGKAGDVSLKLDVYRPKAESKAPRPVVVWIHGGGWRGGNKSSGLVRLAPMVASGEYVGVSVAYRLSDVAKWPAQIHDCKAAIRWIRASATTLKIDPDRIGVWGSSAGGHLVSLLGTSGDVKELEGENGSAGYSSRVACVVDFCGPSDFLAFAKDSQRMRQPDSPVALLFGGPVSEKQDAARQASPATHVSQDDPPFFIVHGTADNTVPLAQAELFYAALQKAKVESKLRKIEGGGHGIGGDEIHAEVRKFFDTQLLKKSG
ncbi:MAG: alpha/beta hydrolase [Planctomycetia bacterium]|nr:alpha/beta hydrolase [Planctomycetia bacterium]